MALLFDLDFELPESVEEAIPTASNFTLKSRITERKLKRYLATRAAETKISCQKAKKFCPGTMCPLFLLPCTYCA
jgi:hypothetical protein